MMAAGLGEEVEGNYREIIQRKPTNAPTPSYLYSWMNMVIMR